MARSTMNQLIHHLRLKVNDATPEDLASDEQYVGDTIRVTGYYYDPAGTLTDPTSPTVTITDPGGTVRVNAQTPTKSATGTYYYDYGAIASVAGQWKAEFAGTISDDNTSYLTTFKVYTVPKYTWTDDELQNFLDMYMTPIRREKLAADVDEQVFESKWKMLEGDPSTWSGSGDPTEVINIWDDNDADATVKTPDDFNLITGTFSFDSEQSDQPYYLDAKSYNISQAIAECFEQLAADPNKYRSWSRGSVTYSSYDLMELARFHRNQMGMRRVVMTRNYR